MFDIIRHKDMTPYASGLRWYKMTMTYDGIATAISSTDFDFVEGQSGAQLPATITGPALINYYDAPTLLNFVVVDTMAIPTIESVLATENSNFSIAFTNVNSTDGQVMSQVQLNPSINYSYPEIDIYVLGYPLNDAIFDTSDL